MPLQPVRSTLCSFLYPPFRRTPPSLVRPPQIRHAGIRMKRREINDKTFPNDIGLLEGHFIMPKQPSLFASPVRRVKLYGHRLFKLYEAFRMMMGFKYGLSKWPRPKFAWRELHRTAREMHKRMYTALAGGDKESLKVICCEGLLKDFQLRISQQKQDYRWTRHSVGFSRVVSSRASLFPDVDNTAIRQHVVKIRSTQSLDPLVAKGKTSQENEYAAGEKKRMTEYLVLQKRILKGKEGPWLLWGTVQETRASDVLKETERKGRAPIIDVVKST